MGKYDKLTKYLVSLPTSQWSAHFQDVEEILGFDLPDSARRHRPWWANQAGMNHSQTKGWMAAGWMTEDVSLEDERVTFVRRRATIRPVMASAIPEADPAPVASTSRPGLSIADAKQALAQFYDTTPEQIEIIIRG
jgi:hypothetical protein